MQHASVFQDSVVIIPTSSACFNSFKSGLISYKVTKINQILKNKKKRKGKKKKKKETKLYAKIVWVHTLCTSCDSTVFLH